MAIFATFGRLACEYAEILQNCILLNPNDLAFA